MNDFSECIVLITGGNSGIGAACTKLFSQLGYTVIIAARNHQKSSQVIEECGSFLGKVIFFQTDISSSSDVINLMSYIDINFGKIDIAINNAGIAGPKSSIEQFSEQDFDNIISTNLKGVWLCLKYELELMKKGDNKSIINVASTAALKAGKLNAAYTASKHAVVGLTKSAAVEYAKYKIRVNAICPAFIDTPLLKNHEYLLTQAETELPLKRYGYPEEVANLILNLSLPGSSFITGISVPIDGGFLA